MASKGWEDLNASACIPSSNLLITRPRDDFGSVRWECDGVNPIIMASKGWEDLNTSACIPNSNGPVIRPRDDSGSIGRERDRRNQKSHHHDLEGVGVSRCQCLYPKLEWSCRLTPRWFWIHQVRMRQKKSCLYGRGAESILETTSCLRYKQLLAGRCDKNSWKYSYLLE